MKCWPIAVLLAAFLCGDLAVADDQAIDAGDSAEHAEALYVHYFQCSYPYSGPPLKGGWGSPWLRDDTYPPRNRIVPPRGIASFRVELGEAYAVSYGKHRWISGKITRHDDTYRVELDCTFVPRIRFAGEVALDQIIVPVDTDSPSAKQSFRVVFSRSKEVEPFLKRQAAIDARDVKPGSPQANEAPARAVEYEDPQIDGDKPEALYLHYIRPKVDRRGDAAAENNLLDYLSPPQQLLAIKIRAATPFEVIQWCTGNVSRKGEGYVAELDGFYHFSGKVELEKVFELEGEKIVAFDANGDPVVLPCYAVVSRSNDIEPFLKAEAEKAPVKPRRAALPQNDLNRAIQGL